MRFALAALVAAVALALALAGTAAAHHSKHHSRFTPNYPAASYWTHRYFGNGWQADLMLCIARRESNYILAATHQNYPTVYGIDYGPWQVNQPSHPWVDFYRIVRSWRYAAAVAWHLSAHGTNFAAWGGRC